MIFKPKQLSREGLEPGALAEDKRSCRRFGPCGVGERALYLNSFYIDRCFYVTLSSVRRVFKRVAMSRGGFTGRDVFASIPYLVVEYDGGRRKQCNFKREEDVDRLLEYFSRVRPDIPRLSEDGERRMAEKARREAARYLKELAPQAQWAREELEKARDRLEENPGPSNRLARAARAKRTSDQSSPAYKWAALTIVVLGAAALAYGVWAWLHKNGGGVYFLLFGMAAIFFFSGANVLLLDQPTNHLDLESIAALNKGLEAVKCNVLVASHDHQLIQTVCNRVFDFTADGKLIDRKMTYDEYLDSQKVQ